MNALDNALAAALGAPPKVIPTPAADPVEEEVVVVAAPVVEAAPVVVAAPVVADIPAPVAVEIEVVAEATPAPVVATPAAATGELEGLSASEDEAAAAPVAAAPVVVEEPKDATPAPKKAGKKPVKKEEVEVEAVDVESIRNTNIVFIGHVDAGKSTLSGQIMVRTGQVDQRTLDKYAREAKAKNRESWLFSWAVDTADAEREKGKTVECALANFETKERKFTLLDAPGHRGYVPAMIAGATQADMACLVISARAGEFEAGFNKGGQTREHALVVKTSGVKHLVVAVNKMDDPSVKWSQERFDEIVEKLSPYLKLVGFNIKTDVHFVPISGFGAINIDEPVPADVCPWWKGATFFGTLDTLPPINRRMGGVVRLPVMNKYAEMGVIATGKLEAGSLKRGQKLLVMPSNKKVEVVDVFLNDTKVSRCDAGDNVQLKIKGASVDDLMIGDVICSADTPATVCTEFVAQILLFELESIIAPGFSSIMHMNATTCEVTMVKFLSKKVFEKVKRSKKKKGSKKEKGAPKERAYTVEKKPKFVSKGDTVLVHCKVSRPVCAGTHATEPAMSRILLRTSTSTFGAGVIIKIIK